VNLDKVPCRHFIETQNYGFIATGVNILLRFFLSVAQSPPMLYGKTCWSNPNACATGGKMKFFGITGFATAAAVVLLLDLALCEIRERTGVMESASAPSRSPSDVRGQRSNAIIGIFEKFSIRRTRS